MISRPLPVPLSIMAAMALALAGCGGEKDRSSEKASLMQASRDWSKAAASGNVDAIVNYWSEDAIVIPPGSPQLRGKPAIRSYIEQSFKLPGFAIQWEPIEASISDDGSMGYLIERTQMRMTGPDGKPVVQAFRGVTVWRRQKDGWRNVLDISNAPPAPALPVAPAT